MADDPGRVRFADGSFIRRGRLPHNTPPEGHCRIPPDLAIEAIAPNDTTRAVEEKVEQWLAASVRLVWVIYPDTQRLDVHRHDGTVSKLRVDDVLSGENEVIKIKFASATCRPCPYRPQCTRAQRYPRRTITLRPREQYAALKSARQRQSTPAFAAEYARRAGIEGTLSYGIRSCGLRRSRYRGLARTHGQHVLTAAAMNLPRVAYWLAGEPRTQTRRSPLRKLWQAAKGTHV